MLDIKKSLIHILSGNLISQVISGILGLYIISKLNIEDYSQYTIYQSLLMLYSGVVVNTTNRIRILSDDVKYSVLFKAQAFLTFLFFIYVCFYTGFNTVFSFLFLFLSFIFLFFENYRISLQKDLDFIKLKNVSLFRVVIYFFTTIFFINYSYKYNSVNIVFVIMISAIFSWFISFVLFREKEYIVKFQGGRRGDISIAFEYFKKYKTILFYMILSAYSAQVDILLLNLFSSNVDISLYGVAFQYYMFLLVIMNSLKQVLLPIMAKDKNKSFYFYFKKLIPLYIVYGLVIILLIVTSKFWIYLLGDLHHDELPYVFSILAISSFISLVFSPASEFIQTRVGGKYLLFCVLFLLPFQLGIGYFMVSSFGAIGAAFVTLGYFSLFNIFLYIKAYRLSCLKG